MPQLVRIGPECNARRFYTVRLAPTLFGQWAVVREWGRLGSSGTVRRDLHDTEAEACEALRVCLRVRKRRGYADPAEQQGMP